MQVFFVQFFCVFLEKEMAIHSSILAWKFPWTEKPGRLQSMGSQRVGHDWVTYISLSVYSCHLFSLSSASIRAIPFLSFMEPIFAWNVPLVSPIFFEEISSLSHFIVFLYFFALVTEEDFLSLLVILWNSAFKWVYLSFSPLLWLLFTLHQFVRSLRQPFCFSVFLFLGDGLAHCSCTVSWTFVHSSSGILSIRSSPLNLFLTSTV